MVGGSVQKAGPLNSHLTSKRIALPNSVGSKVVPPRISRSEIDFAISLARRSHYISSR
jgi:hypothetical protein